MPTIQLYILQDSYVQRVQKKCADCGCRRLATKCRLVATTPGVYPVEVIEWLCNECLTRTPPWPLIVPTD